MEKKSIQLVFDRFDLCHRNSFISLSRRANEAAVAEICKLSLRHQFVEFSGMLWPNISVLCLLSYPGSGVVSDQQPGEAGADAVLQDGWGGRRGNLRQRGELFCLLLLYKRVFILPTLQHKTTLFLISPCAVLLFFDVSPPSFNQRRNTRASCLLHSLIYLFHQQFLPQ